MTKASSTRVTGTEQRKILLLGSTGNVGSELKVAMQGMGEIFMPSRVESDFTNEESLRSLIRRIQPDWIVNAAAYTNVEKAENERDLALQVNATAVRVLAEEASRLGCWLVHYSTDYVFDGRKEGLYVEDDPLGPLCHYAVTKAEGERWVRASNCKHLVLRTSWVYSIHRDNFPMAILKLSEVRDVLKVVNDQTGAPTSAVLIADATVHCMNQIESDNDLHCIGVYHLASSGETTWFDYATMLLREIKKRGRKFQTTDVIPTSSQEYGAKAVRPKNSRLDTTKFQSTFGYVLPNWEIGILEFADSITR
jgi:dTDP-4-dehydrorhamnose reductase